MTSAILDIYGGIADLDVSFESILPTVYNLDDLPHSADTANLPMRLLLPVQRRNRATNFSYQKYGGSEANVTWLVTDVLLLEPVKQGRGLKDVARLLVGYCKSYLDALLSFNPVSGSPIAINNAETAIDVFEWPETSGRYFWGAEIVLTITETI